MHIVGTAGHVDHGKSALVQALTGTNPDRLLEEQQRGMTLDLGFAHLTFPDGTDAGIIDVPGHERFLHNMLAGAASMELLLLVIAADEGVMPQTVEHLQILRYLNVCQVLVVITKSDLLEAAELPARLATIAASLRGTIAENAPAIAVSSATGANLEQLRALIRERLALLPARNVQAPAHLPIDRVFALPGHGTIVTGTLMQGRIANGDRLQLQPSGKTVRVRSLQSFGVSKDSVEGGARVALNLPGVGVDEIARGETLVAPELQPSSSLSVRFEALPEHFAVLRRRTPVRAYIGSAEILGTLVFSKLDRETTMRGELLLRKPAVAYPGTAFVVRTVSPKKLLGGGRIACHPEPVEGGHAVTLLAVLQHRAPALLTPAEIAREANVRESIVQAELRALRERGDVLEVARPNAYLHAGAADALLQKLLRYLDQLHRAEPWAMGATSVALSRVLEIEEAALVRILEAFAQAGRIAHGAGYYARTDHDPKLTAEQRRFFEDVLRVDGAQPLLPAALAGTLAQVKSSRIAGVGKAFDTLLAKGALIKVNGDLYRRSQIVAIRERIQGFLREHDRMTMAQFRDLVGTSRKYTVPLLEWFDGRGITVRSGDYRLLRSADKK